MFTEKDHVDRSYFFRMNQNVTRRNKYRLHKKTNKADVRQHYFANRVQE